MSTLLSSHFADYKRQQSYGLDKEIVYICQVSKKRELTAIGIDEADKAIVYLIKQNPAVDYKISDYNS